ncbi:zinc finger BED domain-containing protein RICESLEEPER 2, partial [Cajanus cajan]|uniref:zinc finger BED domain-containing protein RICESLEEPER 2 n=1 Tax=Cajanus cajan TaxID=3821 RepID=UPI0010FAD40F
IFVGGLDSDISDEELRQPILQFSEVVSVKIPVGKRCGFVQFADSMVYLKNNYMAELNETFVSDTIEHLAEQMLPPRDSEGRKNRSDVWNHFIEEPKPNIDNRAKYTWTSSQNLSYMCLTAHFIDNNWKLQKKVLNFCQVTSHTGKTMAKKVERCLSKWGLNRVLTLTVDNASSNDVGIQYLKKRLMSWNSLVMKGDYIHMRYCAHILNLIVKEGFKDNIDAILRIRGAEKYVRSSPSRLFKFKTCVEKQNIEYKGLVCLDVETRWNSTYLMLEAALKLHKAFEELEMQDKKYIEELEKVKGVPSYADWEFVRAILPFLKLFYDATLRMSGSIYVTSNIYMFEVFGIGKKISQMCNSRDINVCIMAENMKKKYDKYWSNVDRLNVFLLIALVLHPGYKLQFMHWLINQNFDGEVASSLKEKVESSLKLLFQEYNGGRDEIEVNSQEARFNEGGSDDPYGYNHFFQKN